MPLDRINSTSVRDSIIPLPPILYLGRLHQQREFDAITRRVHRRSQQWDQIAIVNGLTCKGPVEENLDTDVKYRVRSRHALELPADDLADRLERLVGLEDWVPVEEPVVVLGKPERLARSTVRVQQRAVGGQMEQGDVVELRRG